VNAVAVVVVAAALIGFALVSVRAAAWPITMPMVFVALGVVTAGPVAASRGRQRRESTSMTESARINSARTADGRRQARMLDFSRSSGAVGRSKLNA